MKNMMNCDLCKKEITFTYKYNERRRGNVTWSDDVCEECHQELKKLPLIEQQDRFRTKKWVTKEQWDNLTETENLFASFQVWRVITKE